MKWKRAHKQQQRRQKRQLNIKNNYKISVLITRATYKKLLGRGKDAPTLELDALSGSSGSSLQKGPTEKRKESILCKQPTAQQNNQLVQKRK
jgi:hypothetical protein